MRVFTGIPLPKAIAEKMEKGRRSFDPSWKSLRWVNFEAVHLTLHFFASLNETRVAELQTITRKTLSEHSSFRICLTGPGFFPSSENPRVFWWGIEDSPALSELHQALSAAYREKGYELEERDFKAHLTLGRFRTTEPQILREDEFEKSWGLRGESFSVKSVKLFKSPAGPEGYPVIDEFPFKL